METEIKLVGVKKTYRMGEVLVPVLQGINAEIYRGELTVILGPSGSGKSTLLNMIGGIDRPSNGEIWFGDRDLAGLSDFELTEYRRQSVGFVFQFYNLVASLTARENVLVSTEVASSAMAPERALELVGLSDYLDYFPAQLSGGQQQRVAIARALAKQPRLMLCDEPTGALDTKTGQTVLQLLMQLNAELQTTIIIITHAADIARLANRVIYLNNGVIADSYRNEQRLGVEEIDW